MILSEALAEVESRGELASAEVLKRLSPVALQHINFYGRYQFDIQGGNPYSTDPGRCPELVSRAPSGIGVAFS